MKLHKIESWLRGKYVDEELTAAAIAKQAGCSAATIYRALRRFSIPIRTSNGYLQGMTFVERFWSNVDKRGTEECWEWRYPSHKQGYGQIYFRSKCEYAHRISYGMAHSIWPLPKNRQVNHFCDNPPCVNPGHLYLGNATTNARDRSELNWEDVCEIRELDNSGEFSRAEIGEMFDINKSTVRNICLYDIWKDGAW